MATTNATNGNPAQDRGIWLDRAAALKQAMCLVALDRSKWGVSRTLRGDQTEEAAGTFNAKADRLRAKKLIVDPKRPTMKKAAAALNVANAAWKAATYWWNEDGWRMIRKDAIEGLTRILDEQQAALDAAVEELIADLPAAIEEAKAELGELFNAADYPNADDLRAAYRIGYGFRALEAASFLRDISPELAAAEEARIAGQVAVAIAETEAEFYEELKDAVDHLTDRLSDSEDGKAKVIRRSSVEAFDALFAKFESMKLPGDRTDRVSNLIASAKDAVAGVDASDLKGDAGAAKRAALKAAMEAVKASIDGSVVERPRRKFRSLEDAMTDAAA